MLKYTLMERLPQPENTDLDPTMLWNDTAQVHEIAHEANAMLEISRAFEQDVIEVQSQAQRNINVNFAIQAAKFLHDNEDLLGEASRSLKQQTADRVAPEAGIEHRNRDFLTQLPDKTLFEFDRINAESDEHKKFIVFDANNFKAVNDTFGHAAGDSVLKLVADVLSTTSAFFKYTKVYRIGGDEFGVICRSENAEAIMDACETAFDLELLASNDITYADGLRLPTEELRYVKLELVGGIGNTAHEADLRMYENKKFSKLRCRD